MRGFWLLVLSGELSGSYAYLLPLLLLLVVLPIQFAWLRWRASAHGSKAFWATLATALLALSPAWLLLHYRGRSELTLAHHPDLLLAVFVVAASLVVGRVVRVRSGEALSLGASTAIASAPLVAGLGLSIWGLSGTVALTAAEPGAHRIPLVIAGGEAQAAAMAVWGCVLSAQLITAVMIGCVTSPPRDPGPPAPLPGALWGGVVLLGMAGAAVAYVPVVHFKRHWPILALVWALPTLWTSSWWLTQTPISGPERRSRALSLVGLGALMMSLVVAAYALQMHTFGLDAIAARSVDPAQRAHILAEMLSDTSGFARFAPLAVLLALVGPVAVLWRAGAGRLALRARSLLPAWPAFGVLVLAIVLWAGFRWQVREAIGGTHVVAAPHLDTQGASSCPAQTGRGWRLSRDLTGAGLFVTADGELLGMAAGETSAAPFTETVDAAMRASMQDGDDRAPLLVADCSLEAGALRTALAPAFERGHRTFRLVLGRRAVLSTDSGIYTAAVTDPDPRVTVPVVWRSELAIEAASLEEEGGMSGTVAMRVQDAAVEAVAMIGDPAHLRYRRSRLVVRLDHRPGTLFPKHDLDDGPFDGLLWRAKTKAWVVSLRHGNTVADLAELILAVQDRDPGLTDEAQRASWEAIHPRPSFVVTFDPSPFDQDAGL